MEVQNKRYSSILYLIDYIAYGLRLCYKLNLSRKSVSVISDNAMIADALATTLNVMELEAAMDYANEYEIKALFIYEQDSKPNLLFSKELQKVKM